MKILKISKKRVIHCCIAVCLLLSGVLSGCRDREAEFLAEFQTVTEEQKEDSGENSSGEKASKDKEKASKDKEKTSEGQKEEPPEVVEPAEIYVDVCGAVASPGVFLLKAGSRVFEAIEAAGGYLPEAARGYINQAEILKDGQQIRIPTEEELRNGSTEGEAREGAAITGNISPEESKVNINLASVEELTTLTGIGETRAKAIISYRETVGPFGSVEQIMEVEGIKAGTFAKIKDEIRVE